MYTLHILWVWQPLFMEIIPYVQFSWKSYLPCPSLEMFLLDKYTLGDESNIIDLPLLIGSSGDHYSLISSTLASGYLNIFLY